MTALVLLAATALPAAAAAAFVTPDYPSADCTPVAGAGQRIGIAPQQWRSAVGLPLTPSGTPAAQRIVLAEIDQSASVDAVNNLMVQCGLPTVSTGINVASTLFPPSTTAPGLEATLDATVAASALPPGASLLVVNAGLQRGMYGVLAAAAEACGVTFSSPPTSGLPTLAKGPDFPAGGCIISTSYGESEAAMAGTGTLADADDLMAQLAGLGVIMVFSADDEGSGGCISSTGSVFGDSVTVDVTSSRATAGTWTLTTRTPHGFAPGEDAFVAFTVTATRHTHVGTFPILTTPTTTTFTFAAGTDTQAEEPTEGLASVDFGGLVADWPASSPHALAVGGTQWAPQSVTTQVPPFPNYQPGVTTTDHVWHDINPNPNCANQPGFPVTGAQGTGGGISDIYARPAYQATAAGAAYPGLPANRTVPDLAALAGWPAYAIANPGLEVVAGEVVAGVATVGVGAYHGFSVGETVEVGAVPAPFAGIVTITDVAPYEFSYAVSSADIPVTRFTPFGTASQSCASYPCAASEFPWTPVFGTSAATPLVAVGIANVNAVLTAAGLPVIDNAGGEMDVHRMVYDTANAAAFTDVTSGDNDLFASVPAIDGWSALPGYDMTTGVGVPNFSALAAAIVGRLRPGPTPSPSPTPSSTPTATPTPSPSATPPTAPASAPTSPAQPPNPPRPVVPAPGVLVLSADAAADVPPRLLLREPAARPRGAPRVEAEARSPIALVVSGLAPASTYRVRLDDGARRVALGSTVTDADALARLPVFQVRAAGEYTVILRDTTASATRFVRLVVEAA